MAETNFDLVVIGAGPGGYHAAIRGAQLGLSVAIVEKDDGTGIGGIGGVCLNWGCIPSKSLLKNAEVVNHLRHAEDWGIEIGEWSASMSKAVDRSRKVSKALTNGIGFLLKKNKITLVQGKATLKSSTQVEVEGGDTLTANNIVIATGARAAVPPIPGLDAVPFLTNETLFELEEQPNRMVIIGGGPIGIEMAQAFARLSTEVTVVDMLGRILAKADADHAEMLKEVLEAEGVRFVLGAGVNRVEEDGDGIAVHLESGDALHADALLLATGRQANMEGLGLEEAGVAFTKHGISVNEKCRTSRRHIYAVGDCTGEYQLTHMSEHMAKVAASNAVLKVPMKIDRKQVPWVTFTSPEIGQLGKTEQQLRDEGTKFEVYRFPYTKVDRAITDGKTTGQIKVFATKWRGKILGVSILGERAGELISLYAVAMRNGVSLKALADTIHPYPSYGLAARRAADQWYARLQSPKAVRLLQRVFRYRGQVPPEVDPERVV